MKIYGITTDINLEDLDKLKEYQVFQMIFNLQRITNWDKDSYYFNKYELDPNYIEMANYNLDYLIFYTRKYGVKFDNLPSNKRIERSEDFNKWYSFWYYTYADMFGKKTFSKDLSCLDDVWNTVPKKHMQKRHINKMF